MLTRVQDNGRNALVAACIFSLVCASAFAQDPRGTIGGRVIDRSEAVVVGAKVQITNVQTKVGTTVRTNETGTFRLPFLIPGTYRVTAETQGFKTATLENIELRVADALDLTIRLEVGSTSEQVTVTAGAPLLETGSSSQERWSTSAE